MQAFDRALDDFTAALPTLRMTHGCGDRLRPNVAVQNDKDLTALGRYLYAETRYPLPQRERACYAAPIFLSRRTKQLTDRRNPGTREQQMQNLQINPQRLWDTLMETAQIGATAKGGICRLTLTDHDRQVRDWFKAQCEALGCTVDGRRGRQHVRAPARQATKTCAPIAMGSHLDTQPTGGKFDGVLGVLGALEAMRTLPRDRLRDQRPDRDRQLDQRGGLALRAGHAAPPASLPACSRPTSPMRAPTATARRFGDELERIGYRGDGQGRRPEARRHVRAAHRAGPDPRGREPA